MKEEKAELPGVKEEDVRLFLKSLSRNLKKSNPRKFQLLLARRKRRQRRKVTRISDAPDVSFLSQESDK
jgi:hypothetical protein